MNKKQTTSNPWPWVGLTLLSIAAAHATAPATAAAAKYEDVIPQKSYDPAAPSYSDAANPSTNYQAALEARSRAEGLGRNTVRLPRVLPGPGRARVLENLVDHFGMAAQAGVDLNNFAQSVDERDYAGAQGDGWVLKVYDDGARVRYRNYRFLNEQAGRSAAGAGAGLRLDAATLASLGANFIHQHLGEVVSLTPAEDLVFAGVRYNHEAVQADAPNARAQVTTRAAAAIFTRTIDGIPVIGPGSRVAVLLTQSGDVFGFDVDWAPLEITTETQEVLGMQNIMERGAALQRLPGNAADIVSERFECGIFDAGARRRTPGQLLQPACASFYSAKLGKESGGKGVKVARVDVVPVGVAPIRDPLWRETGRVLDGDTSRTMPGIGPSPMPTQQRP